MAQEDTNVHCEARDLLLIAVWGDEAATPQAKTSEHIECHHGLEYDIIFPGNPGHSKEYSPSSSGDKKKTTSMSTRLGRLIVKLRGGYDNRVVALLIFQY